MSRLRPIAIYYEHPDWFRPLFAELERREIPYLRVPASRHAFDPAEAPTPDDRPLLVNRMSPSAWRRGRADAILYTLHYLAHLERAGVPVVNGERAFAVEISKALQLSILSGLGLRAPRTRVVDHPTVLPIAAAALEFPLLVKPNVGGSGAGIARFDTLEELEGAVQQGLIVPSIDGILLLQEFHPPLGGSIVRVETLEGRYLYSIRVHLEEDAGFNLCPADLCRTVGGETLRTTVCPVGAAIAGVRVERFDPPAEVRAEVERIAAAAHLDVGGIEYLDSTRDGRRHYYDINALSNFVADPARRGAA